jgi:hypothetical protein
MLAKSTRTSYNAGLDIVYGNPRGLDYAYGIDSGEFQRNYAIFKATFSIPGTNWLAGESIFLAGAATPRGTSAPISMKLLLWINLP